MRKVWVGAVILSVTCLLLAGEALSFRMKEEVGGGRPRKTERTVEHETIQAEVAEKLKGATPEAREQYIQEQIKNLNHRLAYQRELALYRLLYTGEPVKAHLGELLNDKNLRVRLAGVTLAGKLKSVEHLEKIFDIFAKPPDKKTRETARSALLELAPAKPVFFIGQLQSRDREILTLSAEALYANYEKVVPELEKAYRSSENQLVRQNVDVIVRRAVFEILEDLVPDKRKLIYAFGMVRIRYSQEQIRQIAAKAEKLDALTLDIASNIATDPTARFYDRRAALVALGCLPRERAADLLIEQIRQGVADSDAFIHVLGWNAHPKAGKYLGEIFLDPKYAPSSNVIAEALATNPGKELSANLRQMFSDAKTPEESRARLALILGLRNVEGSLELILAQVAGKEDAVVAQYLPALSCYNKPPVQDFFLNLLRRPQVAAALRAPSISYLIEHRNRAALDWLLGNYDGLSPEEKEAFYQSALRSLQPQPERQGCLAMVMFLLPKVDRAKAWPLLSPVNMLVPKNELAGNLEKSKRQEEKYRQELQKILDWWEQNKNEAKYNFPAATPAKP